LVKADFVPLPRLTEQVICPKHAHATHAAGVFGGGRQMRIASIGHEPLRLQA
jgi:hypothetical protein